MGSILLAASLGDNFSDYAGQIAQHGMQSSTKNL
jgi:hypothetical protein